MDTKDSIFLNAKSLFIQEGYAAVNMELIAESTGLSRRTLYRYFESKEQLAFLVVIDILSTFNRFYTELFESLSGSGIENLKTFLCRSVSYMQENLNIMKFLSEFDYTFKDSNSDEPDSPIMEEFVTVSLVSDQLIKTIIEQGIKDGSIDKGLDTDLTVATISHVLWSFGQRVSIRAKHIEKEIGRNAFNLIFHQIDLYIKALKKG